ncbi:C45 family autoproteolytic acyltransferase/hydolase [Amaricoccus macauensis]|uniref:C45 family autoproteolytic acyltransferase/hydolase n=1 Tax=Amaricoccus macauensis TaxID=57001 RepID=UPI003C7B9098
MSIHFRAVSENSPGPIWAGLFREFWPAYHAWWLREGVSGRPTYLESVNALEEYMPELLPLYRELCELAGGKDSQARFLSFYCPPRYLAGCSQAIWQGDMPLLVRNYDYHPKAFDAVLMRTNWQGRQVIGMSDGLFGIVDGMNDRGLAVSLTFGGRREVGEGFGVPLILRYILQVCDTVEDAVKILTRVPCHMSYNVTVLDRTRHFVTAYLTPDRPTIISQTPVATNHQERVEWHSHARLTATVERERFLLNRLTLHPETPEKFIGAFLRPPLYSTAFSIGFGTLYTAAYMPSEGRVQIRWPEHVWNKSFDNFTADYQVIKIPEPQALGT